jgi:TP901 family phage tail tape measure protein
VVLLSLDLTATVDANVSGYERQIDNAINATRRYEASLNSLEADMMALEKSMDDHVAQALERQHDALDKTGKAFVGFGLATAAVLGASAREAVRWESAWAGVTKTTSGSAEEMAQLEADLRALALVLPATHEEIAATAEAAGQLGVAREDIAAFTKTAIDLGETTNLSADEAATAIAQMMNVMQSAPDVVDEIGSTLVALGNDGASTEAQILSMSQRLTGAVKLIGGSEADVLGLASAMSNLGIQAELGGGAMSRTILTIFEAVSEGGDKLDAFARFSGTTASEFASAWSDDPVRALDLFIQGMASSRAEGRNLIGELEDLGLKGTQNMQVLLRLAGAGSELTDALDLSAQAWSDNTALIEEAEKRYETTESKIKMARNQLRDSAIDIGAVVLPALAELLQFGGDLARTWSDLPGPLRDTIVVLGVLTAGVAVFGGAAMIAVPKIAAFKVAVDGLSAGALKTVGTRAMGVAGVLAGPWGLALAGGITALTIFAAKHGEAAREVDALKATLDAQTGAITDNSTEWAIKKLSDEGALDAAKQLGLDLGMITDAALGNKDAMSALAGEYDRLVATMPTISRVVDGKTYTSIDTSSTQYQALDDLRQLLDGTNATLDDARAKWELEKEAKGASKAASDDASQGQAELTTQFTEGAEAAGELAEEIKTVGEQLEELSGAYLGNRAAGRAVRDSLRDIREATREYVKENGSLEGAFKGGTKSGDEFAGLLDALAGDLQNQIDTTERVTGSQEAVMKKYRESRATLRGVAEDLGMGEKAAKDYVDEVLGTPELVKTLFQLNGIDEAKGKLSDLEARLLAIQALAAPTLGFTGFGAGLGVPDGPGKPGKPGKNTPPPNPNPNLPNASRMGAWGAASQQLGGGRTPRGGSTGGGTAGRAGADIDYDRLIGGLATEFRAASGEAHDAIGRGIARESGRGWSEQSRRTRAAGHGGFSR